MLHPIENILTDEQKMWRAFGIGGPIASWDAVDPDTGAFLSGSNGRRKAGRARRWVLILPNRTVQERGGLFESYEWNDGNRSFVTGWTLAEAIIKAQKLLEKMIHSREVA